MAAYDRVAGTLAPWPEPGERAKQGGYNPRPNSVKGLHSGQGTRDPHGQAYLEYYKARPSSGDPTSGMLKWNATGKERSPEGKERAELNAQALSHSLPSAPALGQGLQRHPSALQRPAALGWGRSGGYGAQNRVQGAYVHWGHSSRETIIEP